ncbi:MAG: serine hydrolase [Flavisolibacter sp.]|nr:serine hydrolase [Flavisolibacter sp.]
MKQANFTFPRTDTFLTRLLQAHTAYFDTLLKNNNQWQIQFIYTQIDRNSKNHPSLTNYYFNVDPNRYFYPASTVKLPVAVLALQRLNELAVPGLDRNTTMITDSAFRGQTPVYNDPTAADGRPSVAHYIKKILLVSDNEANNRLYEFLGQEYINHALHKMGYDSAQIIHRLQVSMDEEQHRHTNPITFYDTAGNILYRQPLVKSKLIYQERKTFLGRGYYSEGKLINQPFDFSRKNRLTLIDLHSILQTIIFPGAVDKSQHFNLKEDDYAFLYKYMSLFPRESLFPQYAQYDDAYVKFLLLGGSGAIYNPEIRIYNKVGDAYGFLIDAAYIVDFRNNIEFFLSAVINCNPKGIYNSDDYEYEKVGFPFMKHLGEVIYQYELSRQRKNYPDLSRFKATYAE